MRPIAFASRSLNSHEQNCRISELETLSLVWAVRYFHPYILGHHTVVYTDNSACLSLLNTPCPSGKLAHWAMTVREKDLTLKHHSGKQIVNADALSRNPEELEYSNNKKCSVGVVKSVARSVDHTDVPGDRVDMPSSPNVSELNNDCPGGGAEGVSKVGVGETIGCSGENYDVKLKKSPAAVHELQLKDPDLAVYFSYLEQQVLPDDDSVSKRIVLESKRMEVIDGVLHREDVSDSSRWCVVVPHELRSKLLKEVHSCVFSGHFSEYKVYDHLHRSYWWHGMRSDVRKFCRGCLNCATRKVPGHGISTNASADSH